MLSDKQSQKIAKYRKLAQKNTFCKYLAVFLLISNLIVTKFIAFHRRKIVILGELCLVVVVFSFTTSFIPTVFSTQTEEIQTELSEDVTDDDFEEIIVEESMDEGTEEYDASDYANETADLEDLMERSKENLSKPTVEATDDSAADDWMTLLVNKQHPVPDDYQFTLGVIKGSMRCDERIIEPLTQMFSAAKEDGVNLVVCSPYRDLARQEYLFERKMQGYMASGMSYIDAYKTSSISVTVPGASEHQIGLAVDIISDRYSALNEGFADTEAGKWLHNHSWEYGFILRYPKGKEDITGITYEPWHFRYVGVDAAEIISKEKITLEEFVENN